jgi:death-on-curing protein
VTQEPRWVDPRALLLLHRESLATFGGALGVRDVGLLDLALARPRHQFLYENNHDLAALAAAYGYGIARNHPFVDGNKRVAFLAIGVFLAINDRSLRADPIDAILTMRALAAGQLEEANLAAWVCRHAVARRAKR